ncbi:MAG: ABC transporter substrate-binding protein [Candidatus Methanomethyliaceae archaeon]
MQRWGVVSLALLLMVTGVTFAQTRIDILLSAWWTPGAFVGHQVYYNDILPAFLASHPGIEVRHTYIPFAEIIPTILRGALVQELPHVMYIDNPDVMYLAKAGALRDLTEWVKEWGEWEDFFVGSRYATTLEGRVYAIQYGTNNLALFYNKDYFASAGIKAPPQTWDELVEVCRILREKLPPDVYPFGVSAIDSDEGAWQFLAFLWSNGGSLFELDKSPAIEALRFWVGLVERGYMPKDVVMWTQTMDLMEQFAAGRIAMMINGCWILPDLRARKVNYGVSYIPVPQKGLKPVVAIGGETFAVSPFVPENEARAAFEWIKFMTRADNMARLCAGLGYVPVRFSAVPLTLALEPEVEVFAKQAETALPRPAMGGEEKYPEVSAIMRRYVQKALVGDMPAEQAFIAAAQEIRALFTEEEYQKYATQAAELLAQVRGQ